MVFLILFYLLLSIAVLPGLFRLLREISAGIMKIWRIRRAQKCYITELSEISGPVRVIGRTGSKVTKSPITNSECVLWEVELSEWRESRDAGGYWTRIHHENSAELFDIDDETGQVQVLPSKVTTVILENDVHQTKSCMSYNAFSRQAFLGKDKEWPASNRTIQVQERYILPGEEVFLFGYVQECCGKQVISGGRKDDFIIVSERSEQKTLHHLYKEPVTNVLVLLFLAFVEANFLRLLCKL